MAIFLLFALLPIFASFLAPAVLYRWPVRIIELSSGAENVVAFPDQVIMLALGLFLAWVLAFLASAWCAALLLKRNLKEERPIDDTEMLWRLFVFSSTFGAIVAIVHALLVFPATLEPVMHQLSYLALCAIGLGGYIGSRMSMKTSRRVVFIGCISLAVFGGMLLPLLLGQAAPVMYGMLVVAFLLAVYRARWIAPAAIGAVVLGTMAMTIKSDIREFAFGGGAGFERVPVHEFVREGGGAVAGRLKVMPGSHDAEDMGQLNDEEMAQRLKVMPGSHDAEARRKIFARVDPNFSGLRFWETEGTGWAKYAVARVLHRMNHLGEFAFVIMQTPDKVPYSGITTYLPAVYMMIPRAVLPDKPQNVSGQYFGHRYHFIWPNDTWTSVNLSVVIEGFMAAGVWGVVASAAMFGVFCVVIWAGVVEKAGVLGVIFIGAPFLANIANSESGFAFIVGGGIHAVVVFGLLFLVIRFYQRRHSQEKPPVPTVTKQ